MSEAAGVQQRLQDALAAHQAGRLAAAMQGYRDVLAQQPAEFNALHLLGVALVQQDQPAAGLPHLDQAVALRPASAAALSNRAAALRALGRRDEALAGYDRALALQPGLHDARLGRTLLLLEAGRLAEAMREVEAVLAADPGHADARFQQAGLLARLGQPDQALAAYDALLARHPDRQGAWQARGALLTQLRRPQEALASLHRALLLQPDHPELLVDLGAALRALGRQEDAIAAYGRALQRAPGHAVALNNRGNARRALGQHDAALADYAAALASRPDFADALRNRAILLEDIGRHAEALQDYRAALAMAPEEAETHLGLAMALLRQGDFAAGAAHYSWRWRSRGAPALTRPDTTPWTGQAPLAGQRLLLLHEQGIGDTLQFCRYAADLAAQGAEVSLEVQPPLKRLLQQLPGAASVVGKGEALPAHDLHIPLLELPRACGTEVATIPRNVPYLSPPAEALARWRALLPPQRRRRIGLVISGNPVHDNDHHRSIPLATLLPVLTEAADWHLLQTEIRDADAALLAQHPRIAVHAAALADMAETAALIACLDLVVSVDTSVAHLVGALGAPLWLLLPGNADWRWLIDRDDSPWYPTARLFRQQRLGDWGPVLQRLAAELDQYSNS